MMMPAWVLMLHCPVPNVLNRESHPMFQIVGPEASCGDDLEMALDLC
jgi:hypothetical protein